MSIVVVDRAGASLTGNMRRHNEDSYLIREPLFMVADGMGGARAGEIASQMVADEFARLDLTDRRGEDALREAITRANLRINEHAQTELQVAGMGTTVAVALVEKDDGRIAFANVGDSRAYLLRNGELRLLSQDHSLVAELVRMGQLTEQQARRHPQRAVITRAVGVEPEVRVDTFAIQACARDVVLLCTDGLNSMVDDSTMKRLMESAPDAASMVDGLMRAALANGGEDNVTSVVFRLDKQAD
jgi:serine/threonine protein phosphatase PrpC